MLGDAPLGAEPLGGFGDITVLESTAGGAARFPVSPILHQVRDFHMKKYTYRWWERFLDDYSKVGLPAQEETDELTIAKLFGREI
jgi:hypothetical protein